MPEQIHPLALIIVDDEDMVSSVSAVLQDARWTVVSAANGEQGVKRARDKKPSLIILDLLMPRQDALTTFEQLRRDIVLTSVEEKLGIHFSESDMEIHYGKGPEAFLRKPFEPKVLLETAAAGTKKDE
jgi:two-component system alkaline phosphatase synthesis response regulator PhoP